MYIAILLRRCIGGALHEDDTLDEWKIKLDEKVYRFRHGTSKNKHLEPAWKPYFHFNLLDRPMFTLILDDLVKQLPKARYWNSRKLRCRGGCRCPVYVKRHTINHVSVRPEGQVRFVLRECKRTTPKIQLDSIEFWPSDDLEVDAEETQTVDKNEKSRPLFEVRFRNQYEVSKPMPVVPTKEHAIDIVALPTLPDEGVDQKQGACDHLRLLDVISLLFSFMRARDGVDISLWNIPQTEEAVEFLLIKPYSKLYKHAIEERLSKLGKHIQFKNEWGPFFQHCKPQDLRAGKIFECEFGGIILWC